MKVTNQELLARIEAAEDAIAAYRVERARLIAERKAGDGSEAQRAACARQIVAIGRAPMVARARVLEALDAAPVELDGRIDAIEAFSA